VRLIIVSGLSGSGKSVALHLLEDFGFYCVDNIPVTLLRSFVEEMSTRGDAPLENVGVGIDARARPSDIATVPELVQQFRREGIDCEVVFLQADDDVLLSRFSETRRRHPLTSEEISLPEALAKERELLVPFINTADLIIDTTRTSAYALRERLLERVATRTSASLSILIESFGYKHGLPADADFVFDVRCLPNPYWDPQLRPFTGKDGVVREFLDKQESVQEMIDDIVSFLRRWIPRYRSFQRSYLTVGIGCTGGQHRSVYVAEAVAARLSNDGPILTRHHELP
jgi:UPF0042 nucleotide-binding protein